MQILGLHISRTQDERIDELETEVADLKAQVAALEKIADKRLCKIQRFNIFVQEFKNFSPRLWFEYFSQDAGQFSASKRAEARYQKWARERTPGK